jgi:amino-acid N-acetyltransferase
MSTGEGRVPAGCVLRAAREADMPSIRALVRRERLDPTQLRYRQFRVIECAGQIVACGQLRHFAGAQELGSLVVQSEWRGRHLGALLITHLIQAADAPLYLECRGELAALYRRYGFVPVRWRDLPRSLKPKFGLSRLFSIVVRRPTAMMRSRGRPPDQAP